MNERIKQLAVEAGIITEVWKTDSLGHGYKVPNYEAEKFAELIVRECVRYFNEEYERDFATSWREDLSKGMKEHFGVEE